MEKKIEFKDIVAFIRKAMSKNLDVAIIFDREFTIYNESGEKIEIFYGEDFLSLSNTHGAMTIKYSFTPREKLELESLKLDVREYRARKITNSFNHFFNEDKPTDINDLDEGDDE